MLRQPSLNVATTKEASPQPILAGCAADMWRKPRRHRRRASQATGKGRAATVESALGGRWDASVGFASSVSGEPGWRVWCVVKLCASYEPSGHPRRRAVWTGLPGGTRTGALSGGPGRMG